MTPTITRRPASRRMPVLLSAVTACLVAIPPARMASADDPSPKPDPKPAARPEPKPAPRPESAGEMRWRGRDLFFEGKFAEAIALWDKVAELEPGSAAGLWERGLAYYYVGRFQDAIKQFTAYDTVDKLDIENGLWHYLSTVEAEGADAARKSLLQYTVRRRPPFPALWELYTGKGDAKAVLDSAEKDAGDDERQKKMNNFFARLYLGKHEQAAGRHEAAVTHFEEAVRNRIDVAEFASGHFMWQCARIELARAKAAVAKAKSGAAAPK